MLNIFEESTRFPDFSLQGAYCDNSVGLYPKRYVTFALDQEDRWERETRDVEKVKRKQTDFNLLLQNQAGQILKNKSIMES